VEEITMPLLSDRDILARSSAETAKALIENYDPKLVVHCGCEVRLRQAIAPHEGKIKCSSTTKEKIVVIEPSEMILLVTEEIINMPDDLCATYSQLNRLANSGLMLLNTSIVEPGYSGPLSCVLVNFSSQRRSLSVGDSVAKLTFTTLSSVPASLYQGHFTALEYEKQARKNAVSLPLSLLDIVGVEDRVKNKVGSEVRRSVTFAGIFIAVLLLWSQLEGLISNWLYVKTGYMPTTKLTEQQLDLKLQQQKLDYDKQIQDLKIQLAAKSSK
jgi:deoxycytidine triphosphate deaminase